MIKKISVLFLTTGSIFAFSQIGINTATPDPSAALDIQSKPGASSGFLPTRVLLNSSTDAVTIANPANGLIVYNTNASASNLREGLTLNTGTPSAPVWRSLTPETGVEIGKMIYFDDTINSTKILRKGGFEFRFALSNTTRLQARLAEAPTAPVTISGNRVGWVGTATGLTPISQTWSTSDWSTWKQLDFMNNGASHFFYLKVSNSDQFYKITNFVNQNTFNSLVVEIY